MALTTITYASRNDLIEALRASEHWSDDRIAELSAQLDLRAEIYEEVKFTGQVRADGDFVGTPAKVLLAHSTSGLMIMMDAMRFDRKSRANAV